MKKMVLAVMVAAISYTCADAQTLRGGEKGKEGVIQTPQGPVVKTQPAGKPATTVARPQQGHIKPYAGNRPAMAHNCNKPHIKDAKPKPRNHPGKGHAYGKYKNKHRKHGNHALHSQQPVCNKPAQTLNVFPQQQPGVVRPDGKPGLNSPSPKPIR